MEKISKNETTIITVERKGEISPIIDKEKVTTLWQLALKLFHEGQLRAQEPIYWGKMGVIQAKLFNFKFALNCFKRALIFEPWEPSYYFNIGEILSYIFNKHKEALYYYKKAYSIEPEDPYFSLSLIVNLLINGKEREAKKIIDSILKKKFISDPEVVGELNNLKVKLKNFIYPGRDKIKIEKEGISKNLEELFVVIACERGLKPNYTELGRTLLKQFLSKYKGQKITPIYVITPIIYLIEFKILKRKTKKATYIKGYRLSYKNFNKWTKIIYDSLKPTFQTLLKAKLQ